MPDSLADKNGQPINAVYGFAHFLHKLLQQARPTHIAAVFDESLTSSFRNRIYPEYKANREPAPPELKQQFQICRRMCRALGISQFASKRYEADDLIGSLAKKMRCHGFSVVIVSRDKDLAQLLEPRDTLWDFAENRHIDVSNAKKHYGVGVHQVADWLALAGDAVDNIPGVPGIGKKTAQSLLEQFGSLESVYEQLDDVLQMNIRGAKRTHSLLKEHQELAFLSQSLTRIHCDAKIKTSADDLKWQPDSRKLKRYFTTLGAGQRLYARFEELIDVG